MGVAVLNPQDCLQNPFQRTRNQNRFNRSSQHQRKKRSPNSSPPSRSTSVVSPPKNLVVGQVKILKRGEELKQPTRVDNPTQTDVKKVGKTVDLGSTKRIGPEPQKVQAQIRLTESNKTSLFYAGTAFITSPPPSSLPLPGFTLKKSNATNVKKDEATSDLCRILGLSL